MAGTPQTLEADIALVAIGRAPYTQGLGLEEAGIEIDKRGRVVTDNHYKTNIDGIYAIGDVIAGPMLAHKAEDEGIAIAEILAGQAGHVNYGVIPGVVYTNPEVASVGKTEEELKADGHRIQGGQIPVYRQRARQGDAGEPGVRENPCRQGHRPGSWAAISLARVPGK